jgi:hypothetical protein
MIVRFHGGYFQMLGASPTFGVGSYGSRFNAHELVATRSPGIAPHLIS